MRGMKDGKSYLTINTTKEALAAARALKFDGKTSTWIVADASAKQVEGGVRRSI